MVTGMEDAQFKFMQSLLTEMKLINDHLIDIKKEFKRFNDRVEEEKQKELVKPS